MMVWSQEQKQACRARDIIKSYENKHLPWCVEPMPFEISECNCHNENRPEYLAHYAEWLMAKQDKSIALLQGK
jgi:hypothetical protein